MPPRFVLIFVPFLLLVRLFAQPDVDSYARSIPLRGYDLLQLTDTLTAPFSDDRTKVRAIFIWITAHIGYDCAEANARDSLAQYPEAADRLYSTRSRLRLVLKNRRALCSGYAFLFKTMCDLAEIEARVVEGKADGGNTAADGHAWNAVRLDGQWWWLDPTWASGRCKGQRFERFFLEKWFLNTPENLKHSHTPREGEWE